MRYEVRVIRGNYQQDHRSIQPLDKPLFASNDPAEAMAIAEEQGSATAYGVAIVDHEGNSVDWGDEITDLRGLVTVGELQCYIELW